MRLAAREGSQPYFYIPTAHIIFASKKDNIAYNMTITSLPSGSFFLENLPDIDILTAQTRLLVTITIGDDTIYDEHLYPADGEVTVSDLADIFRPYARRQLAVTATVTIAEEQVPDSGDTDTPAVTDTQSTTLTVYYSTVDIVGIDCQTFLDTHFLTLLEGHKTTYMGRLEYLHYMGKDTAQVTAHYADKTTLLFTAPAVGGNDIYTTIDVSPSRFETEGKDLLYYVVEAGARAMTLIIDDEERDVAPTLLFTNSFGCQELIYCTGKHEVDPQYTRDAAYISGVKVNYRITEQRTFNADTGYLGRDMANWADDLFRSDEVYLVNFVGGDAKVGKRVTLSDSKSKRDNLRDSVPRFTFSYTYAQRQHNVLDLQRAGRIFDNTFDNTFN